MKLSDNAYKTWKVWSLVMMPVLPALVLGMGKVWGLPYAEQIAATILLIVPVLTAWLKMCEIAYDKAALGKEIEAEVKAAETEEVQG